jgi:nucleotide-binding universal stress UspA family protein
MFQHILVPLDGSSRAQRAVPIAARIARASGGYITLLRAVTSSSQIAWQATESIRQQEILDADQARAARYLTRLAASEELAGVKTITQVSIGQPAQLILAVASSQSLDVPPVDLIIMCSHGYTGFKRWALGSVAQKIAYHSTVPVLVLFPDRGTVPSHPYPDPTRPLHAIAAAVALDGSSLAEAALFPAAYLVAALAAPAQGSLHLTQVVQRPGVDAVLAGGKRMDQLRRDQSIAEAMNYLRKIADDLHTSLAGDLNLKVTWSVAVAADVADALIEVAEMGRVGGGTCVYGGCDILALTSYGRGGLQRWALGSVTERILAATKLPLLIVRPQQTRDEG